MDIRPVAALRRAVPLQNRWHGTIPSLRPHVTCLLSCIPRRGGQNGSGSDWIGGYTQILMGRDSPALDKIAHLFYHCRMWLNSSAQSYSSLAALRAVRRRADSARKLGSSLYAARLRLRRDLRMRLPLRRSSPQLGPRQPSGLILVVFSGAAGIPVYPRCFLRNVAGLDFERALNLI